MSRTWFTADQHFGHENVIRFCNRPFSSVEEMDEAMIALWNGVVAPEDTVWHVGDFAYRCHPKRAHEIFSRLNGRKFLVIGNHDKGALHLPWAATPELMAHIAVEGTRIHLCHYAMRTWPGLHRGAIHLFGHSHGRMPGTDRSLDVGVDAWGLQPVSLDAIKVRLKQNPPASDGETELEEESPDA
jgi:calcineurin-like phosphoesterase family protein